MVGAASVDIVWKIDSGTPARTTAHTRTTQCVGGGSVDGALSHDEGLAPVDGAGKSMGWKNV